MGDLITRKDAFDTLTEYYHHRLKTQHESLREALGRVPDAPDFKYNEWCKDCREYDQEKHCCPRYNRVISNTLTEAELMRDRYSRERNPGKWLPDNNSHCEMRFVCSKCHISERVSTVLYKPQWRYCPNCGSKMEIDDISATMKLIEADKGERK